MNDRDTNLTNDERQRYLRHLALPQLGETGQLKLKNSSVLIIGAGGLGSPASIYLAASGVGRIGIIDADQVELSNLQRQILHGSEDVGIAKTTSAKQRLEEMNPLIKVELHEERLNEKNSESIIQPYDVVIDGSDNFPTRYLVNDTCHLLNKQWVYGSIFRFEGQVSVFGADGPCYRCLYPTPPSPEDAPDCSQAGVLGVLPGVIGTIQATEVIKLITGIGTPLSGRVLFYDALSMSFKIFKLSKEAECPLCGLKPTITSVHMQEDHSCQSSSEKEPKSDEVNALELKAMLDSDNPPVLIDIREEWEHALCDIGKSKLIPLNDLTERVGELPQDQKVVLFCRSGARTRQALDHIIGLPPNTSHLKGGILSWSDSVDPTVPKY